VHRGTRSRFDGRLSTTLESSELARTGPGGFTRKRGQGDPRPGGYQDPSCSGARGSERRRRCRGHGSGHPLPRGMTRREGAASREEGAASQEGAVGRGGARCPRGAASPDRCRVPRHVPPARELPARKGAARRGGPSGREGAARWGGAAIRRGGAVPTRQRRPPTQGRWPPADVSDRLGSGRIGWRSARARRRRGCRAGP
jgi:hypothetical protein